MKELVLVRHAKSSWKQDGLTDLARPLNKRGKADAPFMARCLAARSPAARSPAARSPAARGNRPDRIVSSPAARARATAIVFAQAHGYPEEDIVPDPRIYEATVPDLLEVLRNLRDADNRVFLFGHNPSVTEFLVEVAGVNIDNVPTCGVAELRFQTERWQDLEATGAELVDFDYPKKHPERAG